MSLTIPVAHDFICPWCYAAIVQAEKLKQTFDVKFDWLAYELMPEELEWGDSAPKPEIPNKPKTLSRFEFLLAADDMVMPPVERPKRMRSHLAHLATEYAKEQGLGEPFLYELYRALWERGEYINETEFLVREGEKFGLDPNEMRKAIEEDRYADKIIHFDAPAYQSGVFNVPTFYIGGERYAEQPYKVLVKALEETIKAPA